MSMRLVPILLLSLLHIGCAAAEPAFTQSPIVGGRAAAGEHPAVALLLSTSGICTGTLIGPRAVLTAAHCVSGDATRVVFNGEVFYDADRPAIVAEDGGDCTEDASSFTECSLHWSSTAHVHPLWVAGASDQSKFDLAVLYLETAPLVRPVRLSANAPVEGTPLALVGFGLSDPGDPLSPGHKRLARNAVSSVDDRRIRVDGPLGDGSACFGDSGGPALATTASGEHLIVGVTSTGDEDCSVAIYTRTDVARAFIGRWATRAEFVEVAGSCPLGGADCALGWHNDRQPTDVNGNGSTSPLDALLVINALNGEPGVARLTGPNRTGRFLDVNDDGWVAPLDALLVINALGEIARATDPTSAPICAYLPATCGEVDARPAQVMSAEVDGRMLGENGFLVATGETLVLGLAEAEDVALLLRDVHSRDVASVPSLISRDGATSTWDLGVVSPGSYVLQIHAMGACITELPLFVPAAGDANLDGEVNSSDLTQTLTAGKYGSGVAATFEEGDFDGDGTFDSSDLVAMQVQGLYETGPYSPLPSSCLAAGE